jgi:hypothetical protein
MILVAGLLQPDEQTVSANSEKFRGGKIPNSGRVSAASISLGAGS